MKNDAYMNLICSYLRDLHYNYPAIPLGEHIAYALSGSELYSTSDKELALCLSCYLTELEDNDKPPDD